MFEVTFASGLAHSFAERLVGEQAGYGRIVILRHPGGLVSLYAHMRKALVDAPKALLASSSA